MTDLLVMLVPFPFEAQCRDAVPLLPRLGALELPVALLVTDGQLRAGSVK